MRDETDEEREARLAKNRAYRKAYDARPEVKARARERAKAWYAASAENRERARANNARFLAENPEKAAEYNRRWRERNPEKRREVWIRHKYPGITDEDYTAILAHSGACDSCGGEPARHIDHCHTSGRYRGYLCKGCNQAAGLLRDDPERCRALAAYLETH